MRNPTQKVSIEIDTIQATFIFRALLNFKDKINEVLENKEALSIELQEAMEHMKNVATYQDEQTSDIMCMLTETFETDIKYLLPQ